MSKLRLSHKIFTLLLAKSNFHISVFLLVISAYYFQLFTFKFLRKTFQVSVRRFRLSRFSFSSVYCQIPTFRLLLATPIFTLLLCKLLAETTAYFLIVFICVISAQLPHNVPALAAVACDSTQNITNIEIRLEWTAFFRRKNQAQAIAANVCWRMALFLAIQFLFSSDFSIPFFHCLFFYVLTH